jgi:hypothetical protein
MPRRRDPLPRPTVAVRGGGRVPAWLTTGELATLVGLTDRGIRKACAAGRIDAWTVEHGSVIDYVIPTMIADRYARERGRPLTADAVLAVTAGS